MRVSKKILVAGGSGMLGRAVVKSLLKFCPETYVRASYFGQKIASQEKNQVEWIQSDLRSLEQCRALCRGCDEAIMAAATTGGAFQLTKEPWRQVNDNLLMNAQLLEAFYQEGVKRVIFVGSATVYQEKEGGLKEEDLDLNQDPHGAHWGIGWTMRYLEKLCDFWHRTCGMELIIVRAANIFGPFAKFDPKVSNFIPALIRKAVDAMEPFEVWGRPEVTRDVIYSEDIAEAVIKLLNEQRLKFDVFNLGSSQEVTVGEVVKWVNDAAQYNPKKMNYMTDKPVTVKHRFLDCTKIERLLGWRPRHSTKEGIKKTVEWWKENRYKWSR